MEWTFPVQLICCFLKRARLSVIDKLANCSPCFKKVVAFLVNRWRGGFYSSGKMINGRKWWWNGRKNQNEMMFFSLSFYNFASSGTRFGKNLSLWQKCTSLWQCFDSSFLICQNAEPTLVNLWPCWANFHCCKWPNIEK